MEDQRYDLAAERAVIGAAILSNDEARTIRLTPDDFGDPRHGIVWGIVSHLVETGQTVDLVTLNQHLVADPVPGLNAAYLHECTREVTVTSQASAHAAIVRGLAQLRRVHTAALRAIDTVREARWDTADAVLDTMRQEIADAEAHVSTDSGVGFADAITAALDAFEKPTAPPIPTGWADLDENINGGWKRGQLTIVGARPGVGKTLAATNIVSYADDARERVSFYNLEMSADEVVARLVAAKAHVTTSTIENNEMTAEQYARVARVQAEARNSGVVLVSEPTMTVADIRADVARASAQGRTPALIVVDYLQLLAPSATDRDASRERQVSNLARDLKVIALQYDLHVIALAQVNRRSASRTDPRPLLSDLRESGGLEQHADNVILLHRDDEENPGIIEFILAKNRHGPTALVELAWVPRRSTIATMGTYEGQGL